MFMLEHEILEELGKIIHAYVNNKMNESKVKQEISKILGISIDEASLFLDNLLTASKWASQNKTIPNTAIEDVTCFGNIAYCCGAAKPCPMRAYQLTAYGITPKQYTILKDLFGIIIFQASIFRKIDSLINDLKELAKQYGVSDKMIDKTFEKAEKVFK